MGDMRPYPVRREFIEDRRGGRQRRSDGTYMGTGWYPEMHYGKDLERREREIEERERRLEERERMSRMPRRHVGYVSYPEDCYDGDCGEEYYEGDFRVSRGGRYY